MADVNIEISVVAPFYDEELLVDELCRRVASAMESITDCYEVICVNDGSNDGTLQKLYDYRNHNHRFKIIHLSRNFGHQAAYTAGLAYASGNYIVMMDADLQDPPEMIRLLYDRIRNHTFDVVYGIRKERKDKPLKKVVIRIFHYVFSRMSRIAVPPDVGNFSIMTRRAHKHLLNLSEYNRYLPGLRAFIGFPQGFVEYERDRRYAGKAKMKTTKLIQLGLDAIFSFSNIPIKICLYAGIIGVFFFLLVGTVVVTLKLAGRATPGWSSTMFSIYFLGSVQLVFLGILGEYLYRIYNESMKRPVFIVDSLHGLDERDGMGHIK